MASGTPGLSLHQAEPPPFFYRVQHDHSITEQFSPRIPVAGFDTRYEFCHRGSTNAEDWLGAWIIHRHLDWEYRGRTPFISVFANLGEATVRAGTHERWGDRGIRVCHITTSRLQRTFLNVRRWDNTTIRFPVWQFPDHNPELHDYPSTFFSTADARMYLGLQNSWSRNSEWFAIHYIPDAMVTTIDWWEDGTLPSPPVGAHCENGPTTAIQRAIPLAVSGATNGRCGRGPITIDAATFFPPRGTVTLDAGTYNIGGSLVTINGRSTVTMRRNRTGGLTMTIGAGMEIDFFNH